MFAQPMNSTPSRSRRSSAGWLLSLVSGLLFCGAGSSTKGLVADEGIPFFEAHVRPLLVEHCQQCHGPKKQEGGLRLDSRLSLMQGGEHGPAMVPGQPEKSLLVTAVRHTTDLQMPPPANCRNAKSTRWNSGSNRGPLGRLSHSPPDRYWPNCSDNIGPFNRFVTLHSQRWCEPIGNGHRSIVSCWPSLKRPPLCRPLRQIVGP